MKVTRFQRFESRTIHRSQISGAPYNPRVLNPAQKRKLKSLIQKHGFVGGMVWNERTGILVGGHQRLSILDDLEKSADYWITVDVVNVDAIEERSLNVSLNNPETQGQFDFDLLSSLVAEVLEAGGKPEDMGHDAASLSEMFGDEYFSPHVSEQVEEEAPVLDAFEAIKDAGREARRERREQSDGSVGSSGDAGGSGDVRLSGAPPDPEIEEGDLDSGSVDFSESPQPPAGNPGKTKRVWTKEELAARRKEYAASFEERNNADACLTLVCETQAFLLNFMRTLLLDQNRRAFSVHDFLACVDAAGIGRVRAILDRGFGDSPEANNLPAGPAA